MPELTLSKTICSYENVCKHRSAKQDSFRSYLLLKQKCSFKREKSPPQRVSKKKTTRDNAPAQYMYIWRPLSLAILATRGYEIMAKNLGEFACVRDTYWQPLCIYPGPVQRDDVITNENPRDECVKWRMTRKGVDAA